MFILAGIFGAVAGVSGAMVSSTAARLPTGPTIVLCMSAIVLLSLTIAPNRGLVWAWFRRQHARRALRVDAVLRDLEALAGQHATPGHGHPLATLEAMRVGHGNVSRSLGKLEERGFARRLPNGDWALTDRGAREAARLHESGNGGAA